LVRGVPSGGDTSSFLREKRENWCPSVSRGCATSGLWNLFNTTVNSGQKLVLQQDSAPAQKAKTTQEWLRRNVPAFISAILSLSQLTCHTLFKQLGPQWRLSKCSYVVCLSFVLFALSISWNPRTLGSVQMWIFACVHCTRLVPGDWCFMYVTEAIISHMSVLTLCMLC
jgi:hypothetical protein